MKDNTSTNNKAVQLLRKGTPIASTAIGNIITLFSQNPTYSYLGSIGGAFIQVAIEQLADYADRTLSNRESVRVGAAAAIAMERIQERLCQGHKMRDEDFWYTHDEKRTPAEEIFEGVLTKCKNEYQEKKIKYMAYIFANAVFIKDVEDFEVNQIIAIAERLTYTQLSLLALFERKRTFEGLVLRSEDYTGKDHENFDKPSKLNSIPRNVAAICQDIMELNDYGLLEQNDPESGNLSFLTDAKDIIPSQIHLSDLGKRYFMIMSINEIPDNEILRFADILK